jgi:hypothetical protein
MGALSLFPMWKQNLPRRRVEKDVENVSASTRPARNNYGFTENEVPVYRTRFRPNFMDDAYFRSQSVLGCQIK